MLVTTLGPPGSSELLSPSPDINYTLHYVQKSLLPHKGTYVQVLGGQDIFRGTNSVNHRSRGQTHRKGKLLLTWDLLAGECDTGREHGFWSRDFRGFCVFVFWLHHAAGRISSPNQGWNRHPCIGRWCLNHGPPSKSLFEVLIVTCYFSVLHLGKGKKIITSSLGLQEA